jgi:hypothetical protein
LIAWSCGMFDADTLFPLPEVGFQLTTKVAGHLAVQPCFATHEAQPLGAAEVRHRVVERKG